MKRVFVITYADDLGEMWLNKDNLLSCLQQRCPNTDFRIVDMTTELFSIQALLERGLLDPVDE